MLSQLRTRWRNTTLGRSARVLSRKDQKKVVGVIVLQVFMGLLDLAGVAIIGVLGALAVNGVQSKVPGDRVNSVLSALQLGEYEFQIQAAILGAIAALLLVGRTILSIIFIRRILYFLSRRGAFISASLISKLLSRSLLEVQSRTTQQTLYALTSGVNTITMGVLGTTVTLASDTSLLLIMAVGLFIVDPIIALGTFFVFMVIGLAMYRLLHRRARDLGVNDSKLSIESNEKIVEVLSSYRETVVRNRRNYYARQIGDIRFQLADTTAAISFLPNISKYVVETTVVLGALIISAVQFVLQDATHAVATLAVFLAAGTRIAPAVLRLQQGALQIRGSLGTAGPTLSIIEELGDVDEVPKISDEVEISHTNFNSNIQVSGLTFTYPGATRPAIVDATLEIKSGMSVAIVGSSGAGKTTFVDLLLGVIEPDYGSIVISDLTPKEVVSEWPGAIAYVPQDVVISNGTVRENVALGYPARVATDELVWDAIDLAQLRGFISELPMGLDSQVGERGARISGGQRQRLGIARALFTKPKLLVLDEATSSLDGQTEANISEAIQTLKGSVTIVMIAHRLSTVRNADLVVYLEEGRILSQGSFDHVRTSVPNFHQQAQLMGL